MGATPANHVDPALVGPGTGSRGPLFVEPRPPPTRNPRFLEVHPPGYVYRWYAQEIAAELRRRGVVP